jgi:hypothetical protein
MTNTSITYVNCHCSSSGDPRDESRTTNGPAAVLPCWVLVCRQRSFELAGETAVLAENGPIAPTPIIRYT